MKRQRPDGLPETNETKRAALEEVIREAELQKRDFEQKISEAVHRHFTEAGGCTECRGRGWVVKWDTMDSMSGCYAEYGSCPNPECTAETRAASGLDAGMSKYDNNNGVKDPVKQHPLWESAVRPLVELIEQARVEGIRIRIRPRKGDVVVVAKGRKVPVGTKGVVFWLGTNQWGTRLGIKQFDAEGKEVVHWVAESNVEIVEEAE